MTLTFLYWCMKKMEKNSIYEKLYSFLTKWDVLFRIYSKISKLASDLSQKLLFVSSQLFEKYSDKDVSCRARLFNYGYCLNGKQTFLFYKPYRRTHYLPTVSLLLFAPCHSASLKVTKHIQTTTVIESKLQSSSFPSVQKPNGNYQK